MNLTCLSNVSLALCGASLMSGRFFWWIKSISHRFRNYVSNYLYLYSYEAEKL